VKKADAICIAYRAKTKTKTKTKTVMTYMRALH